MDLPTYSEAVTRPNHVEALALVAPHLDSIDFASACLVSRSHYKVLAPVLWSDPIKHITSKTLPFGTLSSAPILTSLTILSAKTAKFFLASRKLRASTRALVICLDFRPLLQRIPLVRAEYELQDILMHVHQGLDHVLLFPNLRFVLLDHTKHHYEVNPFYLQQTSRLTQSQTLVLSLKGVPTLNGSDIVQTHLMTNIMWLDLSYTMTNDIWTRRFTVENLWNLRVLKLRGLRLVDQNLPPGIFSTGLRLWSLDLRDNYLTDQTIEWLLQNCFIPPIAHAAAIISPNSSEALYEDTPVYVRDVFGRNSAPPTNTYPRRPDDADGFMKYLKTHGRLIPTRSNYLHHEVLLGGDPLVKHTGLTQLYLSNNRFTSLGIRRLLRSTNRLQVLDVGSVRAMPAFEFNIPNTTAYAQPDSVSSINRSSGTRLEVLRIHHSIITHTPSFIRGATSSGLDSLYKGEILMCPKQKAKWQRFDPHNNFRLMSLTLTDVPIKSFGPIIDALLLFVSLCASQERRLKRAAKSHYRAPQCLTGLRTLRLEFMKEAEGGEDSESRVGPSVSGDRDADEFLAQSMGDFSFFSDKPSSLSEYGLGNGSGSRRASAVGPSPPTSPYAWGSRRGSVAASVSSLQRTMSPSSAALPLYTEADVRDVVAELKSWRQTDEGKNWGGKLELVRGG
jgi:hypothetical protein